LVWVHKGVHDESTKNRILGRYVSYGVLWVVAVVCNFLFESHRPQDGDDIILAYNAEAKAASAK